MSYTDSPAFFILEDRFSRKSKARFFGHRIRRRLMRLAVATAPVGYRGADIAEVWKADLKAAAKEEYGSVILIILLPVIMELVKMLIIWWLERKENEEIMAVWKDAETR